MLKVDTPAGRAGSATTMTATVSAMTALRSWLGGGRPWPLLTLERATYELAAGNDDDISVERWKNLRRGSD